MGLALLVVAVATFVGLTRRFDATLSNGTRVNGVVSQLISPSGWNPLDDGRIGVTFSVDGVSRHAKIWLDNDLSRYHVGEQLPLWVRGSHVRTKDDVNGPAPLALTLFLTGLAGVSIAVLSGVRLMRRSRRQQRRARGGVLAADASRWQRWMAWDERASDRMGSWLWWYGVPLFALAVTPFVVVDIGPAYEARTGGTPGTFIARDSDCGGRGGCYYYGDFRSDDGRVTRTDVGMASGSDVHGVGDKARAVDTGDRANVYPPGGGSDWLIVTAFIVGIIGFTFAWGVSVFRRLRGTRPQRP